MGREITHLQNRRGWKGAVKQAATAGDGSAWGSSGQRRGTASVGCALTFSCHGFTPPPASLPRWVSPWSSPRRYPTSHCTALPTSGLPTALSASPTDLHARSPPAFPPVPPPALPALPALPARWQHTPPRGAPAPAPEVAVAAAAGGRARVSAARTELRGPQPAAQRSGAPVSAPRSCRPQRRPQCGPRAAGGLRAASGLRAPRRRPRPGPWGLGRRGGAVPSR